MTGSLQLQDVQSNAESSADETTLAGSEPYSATSAASTAPSSCAPTAPAADVSTIPMPKYSDRVMSLLTSNNNILPEIDRMIEETAYHVLKCGDLTTRGDYEVLGRRLYEAYPSIQFPGNEPWVCSVFIYLTYSSSYSEY